MASPLVISGDFSDDMRSLARYCLQRMASHVASSPLGCSSAVKTIGPFIDALLTAAQSDNCDGKIQALRLDHALIDGASGCKWSLYACGIFFRYGHNVPVDLDLAQQFFLLARGVTLTPARPI